MTTQQITAAITAFSTDLSNSTDMADRRNAVKFLADKIGSHAANQIRHVYGLVGDYYSA